MDSKAVLTELLIGIIGIGLTALGAMITALINKYVQNEETKTTLNSLHDVVRNSVLETYQTYVQELKDKDAFNVVAQKKALSACLRLIKVNAPEKVLTWLTANVAHVDEYLKGLIEAQIGDLKNNGKKGG